MVTQAERYGRDDLKPLRGIVCLAAYDHLVRGRANGAGQILGLDLRVRDFDGSRDFDLPPVHVELEVG